MMVEDVRNGLVAATADGNVVATDARMQHDVWGAHLPDGDDLARYNEWVGPDELDYMARIQVAAFEMRAMFASPGPDL